MKLPFVSRKKYERELKALAMELGFYKAAFKKRYDESQNSIAIYLGDYNRKAS